jgi:hypothetical protein
VRIGQEPGPGSAVSQRLNCGRSAMYSILYVVGLIVAVVAVLRLLGLA